jgi:hypothetical protein
LFGSLAHWKFEFVLDFDIRIWNFHDPFTSNQVSYRMKSAWLIWARVSTWRFAWLAALPPVDDPARSGALAPVAGLAEVVHPGLRPVLQRAVFSAHSAVPSQAAGGVLPVEPMVPYRIP